MIKRHASAKWTGDLKEGKGHISTQSGVLEDQPYGFNTRFEDGKGTNPEELIGAAHAGCFSMATSAELGKEGITPDSIETKAVVFLDQVEGGFEIAKVELTTKIVARGANKETVEKAAQDAKEGCPVSKALNANISLDLTVEV
ncbi:peroxiredoxin [Aquisalinus flavus]|uniref:Peroxiredoxin n=1 Tax=Aquisalinus flavus TaxID=1526572 RepID=A0A8J2V633_9PROT|nr:OsmC family protein [Aquisalinus flavus]MBD0428095.1 OsmC family protein [Aquisalinus flavus]GGD18701.1 peroxiredoxin [Aquisalinus flavus]